ncbi:MAG: hypothetical protein LIO79_00670 [Rikenellaceae bacterium]|nr:hypothetical protein [Rikenellaceae bacterium]
MVKKDKYIPWVGAGIAALILASIGRYIALRNDADTDTANLVFIIVLVSICLLYVLCIEVLEPIFKAVLKRIKVIPKYRPSLSEDSELRKKIDSFCRYSDEVLNGYVPEADLTLLYRYIEQYAQGCYDDIHQKINTTGLDNFELYHYGWNIWNHFDVMLQPETADWLIKVFVQLDGSKRSIYKKFKNDERVTYKIPIEPNIK